MSIFEILNTLLLKPLELVFAVVYMLAYKIIENPGLSIIALSLFMNFLVLPLYMRADAIQEEEHALEKKLQESVTQLDMNTASQELFQNWDDTLNIVWKLLEAELDSTAMEALRAEEREWIAAKDAEVEAAGQAAAGGSVQSMDQSLRAAELTQKRVYELAEYAK